MPIQIKVNGAYVEVPPYIKVGGVWSEPADVLVKYLGNWVSIYIIPVSAGSITQIGAAILTPENTIEDSSGSTVYSLLPISTTFNATMYPVLAAKYPTLVTPTLIAPEGSPYEYQIVADLQQETL